MSWGRESSPERGAATVLAVSLAGLLLFVGAAVGVVAGLLADHRRAQAAADLAALAGAQALSGGGLAPCAAADQVALANGARVVFCLAEGATIEVVTQVEGPRWRDWAGELTGRARAGPG